MTFEVVVPSSGAPALSPLEGNVHVVDARAGEQCQGGSAAPSPAPSAAPATLVTDRSSGSSRTGTAAGMSRELAPYGADTVLVATGWSFPDAVAAGPPPGRSARRCC